MAQLHLFSQPPVVCTITLTKPVHVVFTRLRLVNGKSVEKSCLLRRSLPSWWNTTLYRCSMYLAVTMRSWRHCCAIDRWLITVLATTNKGLRMPRAAQGSDQSGTRYSKTDSVIENKQV